MRPTQHGEPTHTKLVATLGPASTPPGRLETLLEAGVDVCRLNFSHGALDEHAAALRRIRDWSATHERIVAVLGDLCGPKIRLNTVRDARFELAEGDTVRFERGDDDCTPQRFTINYARFVDEVSVGHRVYIDDGLVRLIVTEKSDDGVTCSCTAGGSVSSHKGVNLPDTRLSAPALTEKDLRDLDWAIEHKLDYVALSFVRKPADLAKLREIVDSRESDLGLIVKIEKVDALEHLDTFVARADGLMVARGDLGVEMDVWQVPLIQKGIVARCRDAGKPVIVATQMLQSMIEHPTPTRAEVSDVANAILEGADAVMLSAETAAGKYPALAVEIIHNVAVATEAFALRRTATDASESIPTGERRVSAVAEAAVRAARHLDARLVAVWSASGETVRLIARHRLPMPVVGITYDERVERQLNLLYGVIPIRIPPLSNPIEMARRLDQRLLDANLARDGDLIVVVTSSTPTVSGSTDTTLVHRIGQSE